MEKNEFEKMIGLEVSQADYDVIEMVYDYHPSIRIVTGKEQMVDLFFNFGMRVIRDMLPTAQKAGELEQEISALETELERARTEYKNL